MKIFALSDPHLGFAVDKPMDIFGESWKNHPEKIRSNWLSRITQDDLVLVPGDISWGKNFQQAEPDLDFLDNLPGRKFICRGNHDYWWSSRKQVSEFTGDSITVIQRNAIDLGSFILAGSRGWSTPLWDGYSKKDDEKIYTRELGRMDIALSEAKKLNTDSKKIVYMMHYPPVVNREPSRFAEILADYGVSLCVYGHLHGIWPGDVNMEYRGVVYRITSADYLNFIPLDITREVLG